MIYSSFKFQINKWDKFNSKFKLTVKVHFFSSLIKQVLIFIRLLYIILILPQKARIVYYVCDRTFWWYSGLKSKTKFMIKNCSDATIFVLSHISSKYKFLCNWFFILSTSSTWNLFRSPLSLTLGPFLNCVTLSMTILTFHLVSISSTFYIHIFLTNVASAAFSVYM
jgi:hypothetical protein